MNKTELYQKAIDTWGIYSQTLVFHEEMAEVFEIIDGFAEGNITEELADALIMVEQMAHNYGIDLSTTVETSQLLREAYIKVCKHMSHYERGRCDIGVLAKSLIRLDLALLSKQGEESYQQTLLAGTKQQKLHRLASMLGVEYDGH